MMLLLKWLIGSEWRELSVDAADSLTVGRLSRCTVTIDDPTISREHANIYVAGGALHIRNLSKTNAIRFLDGTILTHNESAHLHDNSEFALGKVKVQVIYTEPEAYGLQIRCTSCEKVVKASLADCPWCGASLAFAETFIQY